MKPVLPRRSRAASWTFAAAVVLALAARAGEGGEDLPDSLPPLDDKLLEVPGAPPVRAFAQARLRGELDDSRDLARVDDTALGATLTGRAGVEASASAARATVIVGDGGRLGQPVHVPTLVTVPVASALYEAELALDMSLVGFPAVIALGRAPLVIADGRWVGAEPWDARGRTLDGARVSVHGEGWDALVAAIWLGPAGVDAAAPRDQNPSGLVVTSVRARPIDAVLLNLYGFVHRDSTTPELPLTIPTAGARTRARLSFLELRAGADVQGPVTDERSERFFAGTSGHAELSARAAATLSDWSAMAPDPFVLLAGEMTGGDVVNGRSWRAPAPTQHGQLGLLDFFAADNTWSTALAIGGTTPGGLLLEGVGRVVGVVDAKGPLLDEDGKGITRRNGQGIAFVEGDARLLVPLRGSSTLGVEYAIGVPGGLLTGDAPAQRLMVTLSFAADSDEGATLPPL